MANYSKGKIAIPNVTGNIVINITAVPSYQPMINLVETLGVTENVRISTSSGANTTKSGICAVGSDNTSGHIIPIEVGDIIRVKGADFPLSGDQASVLIFYDDLNGGYSAQTASFLIQGTSTTFIDISNADENGVVEIEIKAVAHNGVGCRLCFPCTSTTNLIVTKNQEIPA